MVPATAGLACAILIFGLVMRNSRDPGQLQANTPKMSRWCLNTGPELQQSAFGTMSSINADSLVIEAYVDANGAGLRITRFSPIRAHAQELMPQVKRMLIFTTFRPAMSMGHPISSRAVLSFAKISVRG